MAKQRPRRLPRKKGPDCNRDGHPRKRRRTVAGQSTEHEPEPPLFVLDKLPLELLGEILSYTSSPRDVLAFARCSKVLCGILVNNPSTAYIWRDARARALPEPIPDPTPNLHEACYAALIYDPGECCVRPFLVSYVNLVALKFDQVCGAFTRRMMSSFALRLRVCSRVRHDSDKWDVFDQGYNAG
jgi:hypothetical protein